MDPKVNYTAVGLYVVGLSLAFALLVIWLSSERTTHYSKYLIYLKESVSGLTEKAPVKFNGVQVGYVDQIAIDPQDPQQVKLVVKINQEIPITKSTTATLMSQGITGNAYIGLKAFTSNAPPLKKHPSEPYPVIPSEPSLLVQLNDALRDVTDGFKKMSGSFKGVNDSVNHLLTPENLTALSNILNKTSAASNQFPDTVEKINGAAAGLAKASDQIKTTLSNSESTIKNLDNTLKSLNDQTLPEIFQAARSLKETLQNVKEVTNQMKQNPSVIVRGSQPLPLGPGE